MNAERSQERIDAPSCCVHVVIVNYNGGDYILDCLAAVAEQSRPADSVIVVDNKSTDGSVEKIAEHYPWVRLYRLGSNTGFAAANNHGFERIGPCSQDDWVALLNPDAQPRKNWIQTLLSAVHANPSVDVFGSKLVSSDDHQVIDGEGDIHHVSGLSWRKHHGMHERTTKTKPFGDPPFSPCGAAALYRLEKVNEVGGMDENYFCYHEDVDLMFRMRLMGSEFHYVSESVVEHVGSAISGKDSDFCVYHGHRNLVFTYIKNMPGRLFWIYLPQHLLLNLISLFVFIAKGRSKVILRSKWDAIKQLPRIMKQRRQIQAARRVAVTEIRESLSKGMGKPYLSRRSQ